MTSEGILAENCRFGRFFDFFGLARLRAELDRDFGRLAEVDDDGRDLSPWGVPVLD